MGLFPSAIHKMLGVKTLAHQPPLHVHKAHENCINRAVGNLVLKSVEGEHEQPFAY
ncbi:hypothetical protein PHIN109289_12745 [Phaeobacter inhibens]